MSDEKSPKGQVETDPAEVENLLTYADLLQLEWVFADKIDEWIWRNDGETDNSIKRGIFINQAIRNRVDLGFGEGRVWA